jgi:Cytochrome c554 and c-prime
LDNADPSKPAESTADRQPTRDAIVVGFVGVTLLGAVLAWATWGGGPKTERVPLTVGRRVDPRIADYVGDRACRQCHPGETALFSRSGHSQTLRPAASLPRAQWLDGRRVADPERPGVAWTYALRDGQLSVDRNEQGKTEHYVIDYAFGSGHHAMTFVSMLDRDPTHPAALEHRLSYYSQSDSLDLTPGHVVIAGRPGTTPHGRELPPAKALKCFDCHTTITSNLGQDVLDVATMRPNISCERCHGPARAHVVAARRGDEDLAMPFGYERWTAAEQMRLCGHCHRHPDQRSLDELRPENPELVRFQPVGLMLSACYTKSQGALSCVNCHDPHAKASSDRTSYEPVCLSCHQSAPQQTCPVSPLKGCIDCHMPRKDAGQGVLFTDHWIRSPKQ